MGRAKGQFDFRVYRRWFRQPLLTSQGLWRDRQGIIIRLQDEVGNVGYGEIAPLPGFGTESQAAAIAFCQALPRALELGQLERLHLPGTATQFAFASALAQLSPRFEPQSDGYCLPICTLLPTGAEVLEAVQWEKKSGGTYTYKWKIGITDPAQEQAILRRLCDQLGVPLGDHRYHQPDQQCDHHPHPQAALPATVHLRLDANGGLTLTQAEQWLALCDELGIEYLEQPLPPEQFDAMLLLAQRYTTPIALDESVANLAQLRACYERGWRGIVVIKGAIAGSPQPLLEFCLSHKLDVVFSSVFETGIGRRAVLDLAQSYAQARPTQPTRALGFGVEHWLEADGLDPGDAAQIWERLAPRTTTLKPSSETSLSRSGEVSN